MGQSTSDSLSKMMKFVFSLWSPPRPPSLKPTRSSTPTPHLQPTAPPTTGPSLTPPTSPTATLQPRLPLQLRHPPHDEARCRGRAPDLHSVLPVCLALHLPSARLHQHPPPAARRQDRRRPCGP